MTEVDEFLAEVIPRQLVSDTALQNGDDGPRIAMWSDREPVTLYGAWITATGVPEVRNAFAALAARFSNSESFDIEVVAAGVSGTLGYVVMIERCRLSVDGVPTPMEIRVTHVYRREEGTWRIVHRHGDFPPSWPGRPGAIAPAA